MISDKYVLSAVLAFILLLYLVQNDVSGIKSAAYWGFLGIIFFLVFILIDYFYSSWIEISFGDDIVNLVYKVNILESSDAISCIACIILSFSFHTYTFSIYQCLHEANTKSMMITTSIGIFMSTIIYLLVGTVGYILYEDTINEYYVLYDNNLTSLAVLENIAFVVNVVMSFPLTFFALRHYWIFFIKILYTIIRNKITGIDTLIHHEHEHDHNDADHTHKGLHQNCTEENTDSNNCHTQNEKKGNNSIPKSI